MNAEATGRFDRHRRALVRHAYRMLGEHADAEDIVHDAYLRWTTAAATSDVTDDRAYLRTIVTRLCLDRLRSARARREVYVGSWLPEPVLDDPPDDPQHLAALADDVSFALLLALERLSPLERAAFLLHDALDVPFAEIAQTLERSEAAVRRLASRGREHVRDAHRRAQVPREEALRLRDAFASALANDDLSALQRLLTSDVVFTSDGGGKVPAALVPVVGCDHVSRLLIGLRRKTLTQVRDVKLVTLNGMPGFVVLGDEGVLQALALEVWEGQIAALYAVRNPDKLRAIAKRFAVM
jgi:RNA polymerase sigma-70 factor (ECF subfamily)